MNEALEVVSHPNSEKKSGRLPGRLVASILICCAFLGGLLIGGILWGTPVFTEQTPKEEPFGLYDIDERLHAYSFKTPFWYDLDGDGQEEKYIFAVGFHETLLYGLVENDVSGIRIGRDYMQIRDPFPCVWKYTEDGEFVKVPEFSVLLEDPKTELRFLSDWETSQPIIHPLVCDWEGGLLVFFGEEHYGTWIYEISARIGGKELTAAATSSFYQWDGSDE